MIALRDAQPDDARALAALHVRTWREAYWGVLPDAVVLRETVEGRARFWRTHLARIRLSRWSRDENVTLAEEEDGGLVGFAWTGDARGPKAEWDGEIYMLYVLAAAQRQGVGQALMAEAAKSLARRGFFRIGLWVLEDNGPARAFYEALGGGQTGVRRVHGATSAETAAGYAWQDASVLFGESTARP